MSDSDVDNDESYPARVKPAIVTSLNRPMSNMNDDKCISPNIINEINDKNLDVKKIKNSKDDLKNIVGSIGEIPKFKGKVNKNSGDLSEGSYKGWKHDDMDDSSNTDSEYKLPLDLYELQQKDNRQDSTNSSISKKSCIKVPLKSDDKKIDNRQYSMNSSISKKSCIKVPLKSDDRKEEEIKIEDPDAYLKLDENPIRGHWTGKFDYVLSTLGYAVGLGNVWRFPYMCFKYGGGAFLIPYLLSLIFVGIPMFFVDVTIGQFTSQGPFTCWEYAPIFTGIGYAMVTISTIVSIYYNVIIGYSIYYIVASIFLPWKNCNNHWNTKYCRGNYPVVNCTMNNSYTNGTCFDSNNTLLGVWNMSVFTKSTNITLSMAADEYLNFEFLKISPDINVTGMFQWRLVLSLLAAWVLVFGCLYNGIKSSGKSVYFTAVFPYVCLIILFFRGVLLDGATNGMKLYIIPDIGKLSDPSVWVQAASQIFFSLSTNWGGLITLSSYNRFNDNNLRDTIVVSLINCATSIIAGFMIFCYLGYLAKLYDTSVDAIASQGMGLGFVIVPEAMTNLDGSYAWCALFFIMVLTMGLSSQCTTVENTITSFVDFFPDVLRHRKKYLLAFVCVALFLLGLPMCTQSGIYWLSMMDSYCGGWSILLIALCEVISVSWVYGRPGFNWKKPMRMLRDLELMLQKPVSNWWRLCWQWITPIILLILMIYSWKSYSRITYNDKLYPIWADILGWLMTLFSLSFIPGTVIYLVIKEKRLYPDHTFKRIFSDLSLPTYKWGPYLPKFRMLVAEQLEDGDNVFIDVKRRIKYKDVKGKVTEVEWTKF